jgi:CelD/BcsL family acetyltransferase involved in cellulose biosynthesis
MSGFDNAIAAIASVRRAATADRYSAMSFDVEWYPLAELAFLADDWRMLASRALEPNAFYEPGFALAATPLFGADVRAALVWSRAPRQLVGFFPMRVERRRYGIPFAIMVGWTHPYAPLGTPLVDRDMAEPVVAAWIDDLAADASLPGVMLMPLLAQSGPLATALADVLAQRGCQATSFDRHQRALLVPGDSRADYFQRTMSSKRLRNMRRRQRRLQDLGTVTIDQANGIDAIARGLDDFLLIEASGWKGRAGTAILKNERTREFIQQAVMTLGNEGKVLIHRLMANGKAIGTTLALKSGDTAWGWKVAYDEAYADYSPGVLTVAGLTESILADPLVARVDSCTTADSTTACDLWSERLTMADWLFSTRADAEFSFGIASRMESLRRAAIAAAKSARDHIRGR